MLIETWSKYSWCGNQMRRKVNENGIVHHEDFPIFFSLNDLIRSNCLASIMLQKCHTQTLTLIMSTEIYIWCMILVCFCTCSCLKLQHCSTAKLASVWSNEFFYSKTRISDVGWLENVFVIDKPGLCNAAHSFSNGTQLWCEDVTQFINMMQCIFVWKWTKEVTI